MSDLLSRRLALLGERANLPLLTRCLHGIERECLRVDGNGQLALTPHSPALGSALTHAQITTDYSESLLEFITPAEVDPAKTLADLEKIHRFTLSGQTQDVLVGGGCLSDPLLLEGLFDLENAVPESGRFLKFLAIRRAFHLAA